MDEYESPEMSTINQIQLPDGSIYGFEDINARDEVSYIRSDVDELEERVNSLKSDLVNKLYPVGSIYMSVNPTNPAELFGGTWEQIKDRFLLAAGDAYAAGSTGGEATHTHKYGFQFGVYYGSTILEDSQAGALQDGTGKPVGGNFVGITDVLVNNNAASATKPTNAVHYASVADTSSASNMPPYLAVYMWKRTA